MLTFASLSRQTVVDRRVQVLVSAIYSHDVQAAVYLL